MDFYVQTNKSKSCENKAMHNMTWNNAPKMKNKFAIPIVSLLLLLGYIILIRYQTLSGV